MNHFLKFDFFPIGKTDEKQRKNTENLRKIGFQLKRFLVLIVTQR